MGEALAVDKKSVREMMRDAYESGRASELADFVAGGGIIPSESLIELLRSARIVKPSGGQKGPRLPADEIKQNIKLARLCAAYIVSSCVLKYNEWREKPLAPSDALMKELSDRAEKIACDFYGIESGSRYEVGNIINSKGAKQFLYQKGAHSEIAEIVHAGMHDDLMKLIDWMVTKYFPDHSPSGDTV